MHRLLAPLLAALMLAGCAGYTLVETTRQQLADRFSVEPQRPWSRIKQGNAELWTVDGSGLQALRFFDALGDGGVLFPVPTAENAKLPAYNPAMSATEIQEFIVHSIERSGGAGVSARGLRPWRLGTLEGFRFEFDFLNASGLEMSGIAAGAVDGGKLYLIVYSGTRAHYFPKHLPEVERLLGSVLLRS